jgi:hypothetical protein
MQASKSMQLHKIVAATYLVVVLNTKTNGVLKVLAW